jgi:hypothetical protein
MGTDQQVQYSLTNDSVTVVIDGQPQTVRKGAANYELLRRAVIAEDFDAVRKNATVVKSLSSYTNGKFTCTDQKTVLFDGQPIPEGLNKKIVAMVSAGDDPQRLMQFWERLQRNPSYRSVNQLWNFLEKNTGIPLTPDGCFLAYKGVTTKFRDHHSGQFDNRPGVTNKMPRNKISDDSAALCDPGFHVGGRGYAKGMGSGDNIVVICKVDPEHVVSVPNDFNGQKMRVCQYEVIGVDGGELPEGSFEPDVKVKAVKPRNLDRAQSPEEKKAANAAPAAIKLKMPKAFAKIHKLTGDKLEEKSIEELRKYAAAGLKILGASKIHGGKTALLKRIMEVRQAAVEG